MKPVIYCVTGKKGVHDFYLRTDEGTFYMFSQDYRKSVQDYFGYTRKVILDEALDYTSGRRDSAIMRTKDKLPSYIRYLEKEYEISIFEKTKERKNQKRKIC